MRWSSLTERVVGWLLPVLAIVAEGAWLAVVYVAIETTIDARRPLLGTFELAVVAGIAAVVVRRRMLRPDDQPLTFFVVLALAGAIGWTWDDRVRELLASGNLAAAVGFHPGGWLFVVAFMRGVGRGVDIDDRALTRLVLLGVPALALPWILGQLGAGALHPEFVEEAFVASLTFVAAGFMAAGLARLQEIGRETGVDWRRNRSWLGTILGVLAIVLAVGIPASAVLGLPVDTVARGLVGPVLALIGYVLLALVFVASILSAALYEVLSRLGFALPPPLTPQELARLPELREYTIEQLQGPILTVVIGWAAIALLAVIVIRVWVRRRVRRPTRGGSEERSFALPQRSFAIRPPRIDRPGRRRRGGTPENAVEAYLAALDELRDRDAPRARREHETPRGHATRVQLPELAPLQADYALVRYGGRLLSPTEERRAIGRWRRLRDRLRGLH
ncbi:MAG: hypothetical protein K5924_10935 [Chloroflexi bacterium]|nr:hypothetical protein [Chloroflexota bacterium]